MEYEQRTCLLSLSLNACNFLSLIRQSTFYFFAYPREELSKYIKYFNCSLTTKPSHSRADIFTFIFIYYKRIYSLVFVASGGDSCFLDEDVHPFTSSFIILTRLLLLHLRIPISSSSLLLTFIFSSII